jgi:hypothetical protein
MTFPALVDTGSRGFSLCLFWRDVAEGGVKPLTIIVSFDIGKQVSFRCFARGIRGLVDEFGFQRSKAAFHGRVIPVISFSARGLDHSSCLDEFAVFGSGVLAAADRSGGSDLAAAFAFGWPSAGPQ